MIAALDMRFFHEPLKNKLLDYARPRGIVAVGGIYLPFNTAWKLYNCLHSLSMWRSDTGVRTTRRGWQSAGLDHNEFKAFTRALIKETNAHREHVLKPMPMTAVDGGGFSWPSYS